MPLKPAVSALARNTIKTAYDELDRTINLADKRDFPNTALQDVREAALKIENQLAARQSLRNMRRLMPLFRGLEHYSKVVDILCNGTPYLPWVWAPITLILRIASEFVEAFEQIIKGYASIAESLKRFEILSDVFINEPDFQQTVAVFYADILKFHKYAYKFVRRSGWTLIFSASWGRFERRFGNILEDLKQHGTLIDLEANARDISQAKTMRDDIRKWREESENRVRQEDIEHSSKQYESIVSWLKVNDADQLAIIDSISSEAAEYPGTCGWVLKNKKVSSWADAKPDTPALWLKGSAGTGKSVLCTQLVNFLKGTKFVVCHFCTYLYASSTMYEQILKSLLLQILRQDADLAAHVYKSCIMEKKSPTTTALEQLLQKLLASMSSEPNQAEYIWVVIDGLDECDPDKQLRLVRLINQLTSKPVVPGSTACKVLLSSRAPSISLEGLKRKQIVSLGEEKTLLNAAIRQYVDQRLKSMDIKLRQLNLQHAEIEEIQGVIVTKSDGMFLYARLVMDYLSSNIFFGGDEFKESVNQLPRKLTDFYQKILSQILAPLDRRSEDRIRCILGWIAFAKRPLRKAELLSAITFSSGDPKVSDLVPEYIIDMTVKQQRSTTQPVSDKIGTLLASYQELVKFLLSQTYYPSLSPDELESFKVHFGTAAFTCRLTSCSYATIGFDTAKLLMKHERTHIRWFQCRRRESSANQPQEQQPGQQGQQPQQPQQSGQNNADPGTQPAGAPGPNAMYRYQPQVPQNFPPEVLQVSPREIAHFRNEQPYVAHMHDDQLRQLILQMKKESWMRKQQAQAQTQAYHHRAQNQMGVPQGPMQQQPPQPNQTPQPKNPPVPRRLHALIRKAQRELNREFIPDIPMTPQEHSETATKLQRIAVDMNKIGRGLNRWYIITRDDARARIFFRMASSEPNIMTYTNSTQRWRILKQFADGEKMSILKDAFSIRSFEIDEARFMLEQMARDLVDAQNLDMAKQQGTPQTQNVQLTQPQQPMPQHQQAAPVNGENMRKNSQAQSTTPEGGDKGAQA
ncbi:hypothetical protein IL306_008312 [Fusarium sp. DS 682]|nr:hypothetical protein IL306_008312 [Fusarium sp. DS 682]